MSVVHCASVSACRLTRLYRIALGSIALLAILGQIFFQIMIQQQAGSALLINIAGRQRMLSEEMSKAALALVVSTDVNEQGKYIHELQTTFILWKRVHQELQHGGGALGLSGVNSVAVIRQFAAINLHYQSLAQSISAILSIVERPTWSSEHAQQLAALKPWLHTILIHEPDFLQGMDTIVSLYQQEADGRLTRLKIAEFAFLIIILLALFVEGYVVFRPALRQLRATLNAHAAAATALRKSEERYRMVISNAPVVLFALDADGIITLSEGRGLQALRRQSEQVVGQSVFEVYRDFPSVFPSLQRALAGETLAVCNRMGDVVFEAQLSPLYDEQQERVGVIGVATDISERVRAEESLRHQAWYDQVTDLPNRIQLEMRLERALNERKQDQECLSLLLLNIARFKDVNDAFGHHEGDRLLRQIGERVSRLVATTDTVARIGDDEFSILLPTAHEACARAMASIIVQSFDEPFLIAEQSLQLQVNVGLVFAPTHGSDALTLLRRADLALSIARRTRTAIACYDPVYEQECTQRLALMGALRQAIAEGQLYLVYQPQADLATGLVHGVEALVRWQHPIYGMVPTDRFIPLAEQIGLITVLTHWVLETAVRQCKAWRETGQNLVVSVNLSTGDLHDTTLPERIAELLEQFAVPARLLRVELIESAVMSDAPQALRILQRIAALGVSISVDDFGTGYSSLAYLKSLPVDELKIDRSFVSQMATVTADAMIVESTIALAHSLGLRVVAEGVEDQTTWNLLADLGCDTVQGYYLSYPLSVKDLEGWLARVPQLMDDRGISLLTHL